MVLWKLKVLCEWKRQQLVSVLSVSPFVHLIDGYKSQQSRLDSQFREFDLVKDMTFVLHSPKPASTLFLCSTLSYLEKQTHLPLLNEIFHNYSFSSLVLINFPFSLNFHNISEGFFLLFISPLFLLMPMLLLFLKMLFTVRSSYQRHYLRILITKIIIWKEKGFHGK